MVVVVEIFRAGTEVQGQQAAAAAVAVAWTLSV